MEHLADIALNGAIDKQGILTRIEIITNLGMSGKIPFKTSLNERLKFFHPEKQHIRELVELLKNTVTPSILKNKNFFQKERNNIYIVSGGFFEYIWPVMEDFCLKKSHVLANRFGFDGRDMVSLNKVEMVRPLNLKGKTLVLGDGYTDFEIKKSGLAQYFFAFTGNVKRKGIVDKADYVVDDFDEFVKIVTTKL